MAEVILLAAVALVAEVLAAVALVAEVSVAVQAAEALVEAAILSEVAVVREAVLVANMVTSVADRAFFTTILFNGEDSNLTVFHSRNLIHLLIEKHSLNSFIDDTMTYGEYCLIGESLTQPTEKLPCPFF